MKKHIPLKLMALVIACCLHSAQAATISVDLPGPTPLNYTTTAGTAFDANLYITGIPDFGGFDFSINFDSTKLSLDAANPFTSAYVFGHDGTEADPSNTTSPTSIFGNNLTSPGTFYFAETINKQSVNALTAGLTVTDQAPLLLGTLHFVADNTVVKSTIGISGGTDIYPLINGFDATTTSYPTPQIPLFLDGAFVTVTPPAVVPLPAAAWLFAPGLLAVFGFRKQKSV